MRKPRWDDALAKASHDTHLGPLHAWRRRADGVSRDEGLVRRSGGPDGRTPPRIFNNSPLHSPVMLAQRLLATRAARRRA
jgi:hypothetical protein